MNTYRIDINCDMGEEIAGEAAIFPYISSANISCGLHAGNEAVIRTTMRLAQQFGVQIGAHPSFDDREHFGRSPHKLPPAEIYALIIRQLTRMQKIAEEEKVTLCHVKPHGALYNISAKDASAAGAIAQAVKDFDGSLLLYGLSGSLSLAAAKSRGLTTVSEVFADRRYQPDGSLMPRTIPGAVLESIEEVTSQALSLAKEGSVRSNNGSIIMLKAETICIHSDTGNAPEIAREIAAAFRENKITVKAYARE
ncbi:MAG: LamB/YcsF family protein [Chitinophagaceae bacterium]|nr:LamB/YcsF family protein [Chitinophagaceae bacterium]MCW5929320.1 LamB/YcsF family protein [Chitinophagaceae bacterium]